MGSALVLILEDEFLIEFYCVEKLLKLKKIHLNKTPILKRKTKPQTRNFESKASLKKTLILFSFHFLDQKLFFMWLSFYFLKWEITLLNLWIKIESLRQMISGDFPQKTFHIKCQINLKVKKKNAIKKAWYKHKGKK